MVSWCLSRSTELPAGTARTKTDPDEAVLTSRQILAVDHVETDDHGACSLPRHTIRERID
jgi:hypothetical protein